VFLQGLLLMDPETLSPYFDSIRKHLKQYHKWLGQRALTPVQAALGFVIGLEEIDKIICGVNNHQQLEEICIAAEPIAAEDFCDYAITDEFILNPSLWNANAR